MTLMLALMGWEAHVVDGVTVWLHVSGLVVYNQAASS